jgi:biotin transport system substrate-specific component
MSIKMMVYTALMTALIIAGAYLAIPVGPVPIVLQNFFILLTGLLLGSRRGLAAIGFYILLGAIGFPVFSKGGAGIGHILGPTGGYLLGYIPAVFLIGLVSEKGLAWAKKADRKWPSLALDLAGLLAGTVLIYACGVLWLKAMTNMDWTKALAAGFLPFIGFDLIKLLAALLLAPVIRPLMNRDAPISPSTES